MRWTEQQLRDYRERAKRVASSLGTDNAALPHPGIKPVRVELRPTTDVVALNKLESRFYEHAKRTFPWVRPHCFKLRLADGAWYTPDFWAVRDDALVVFETKGFMREAARVRINVAAALYPFLRFVLVRWVNQQWQFEEVKP